MELTRPPQRHPGSALSIAGAVSVPTERHTVTDQELNELLDQAHQYYTANMQQFLTTSDEEHNR